MLLQETLNFILCSLGGPSPPPSGYAPGSSISGSGLDPDLAGSENSGSNASLIVESSGSSSGSSNSGSGNGSGSRKFQ